MVQRRTIIHKDLFIDEDELFFNRALDKLRKEIRKGNTLDQAGRALTWMDNESKNTVVNEFIKIIIAEQHFGNGRGIDDIALFLGVPYEKIECFRGMVEKELSLFFPDFEDTGYNETTH